MKNILRKFDAFTLVELMVVMVLTFIASVLIYKSYQTFSLTTENQEQYIELNQNLRIGLDTMISEMRMAGYKDADPKRSPPGGVGFVMATASTVRFTLDYTGGGDDSFDNDKDGQVDEADEGSGRVSDGIDNDGDGVIDNEFPYSDGKVGATMSNPLPNNGEDVTFALSAANANGSFNLQRTDNTGAAGAQTIVENVDALNFVYRDANDNVINPNTQVLRDSIRTVEVVMVVRSSDMDLEINDATAYVNSQGTMIYQAPAANNQRRYRRRLLTARINCRNMGL